MNNAPQDYDCPPRMSDARHGTDYRPSCTRYQEIAGQFKLMNSNQMRAFLQRNAQQVRAQDLQAFAGMASCSSCKFFYPDPNGQDAFRAKYKASLMK